MNDAIRNIQPSACYTVSPLFAMVLAAAFTAAGIFLGLRFSQTNVDLVDSSQLQLLLNADSAARGRGVSLATGAVDTTVEGLFVLDHLTGNLECWVLNTRNGRVAARYRTNVIERLGTEKSGDADYVLVTGRFVFEGGVQENLRPGRSICYVADGNSGKVVGYGLRFNRQAMLQGDQQKGELFVVCQGFIRGESLERDQ